MKTCYLCKGKLEARLITVPRQRNGKLVIIEDVPAEVCTQCGEKYFGPEATLVMSRMLDTEPAPSERTITVPVRTFSKKVLAVKAKQMKAVKPGDKEAR